MSDALRGKNGRVQHDMTALRHHMLAGFPPSVSPSSHAVEADGFVFLSGQFPRALAGC